MTTFNVAITAGGDDAQEQSGTVVTTQTSSTAIDSTSEYLGLRFQNVTVPNAATINSASVSVVPFNNANDEPDHPIWADDVDNAAAWSAGATSDISGRTATTATVTWSSADLGATGSSRHSTSDLSTIVQEVVNRAGWSSGNAMAFIIQGSSNAARDLAIWHYENGSLIPELDIDYTAGGGGTNPKGPFSNPFMGPFGGPV